ncbi:hypothetical protein AVEN_224026-1 [Araneus ventricosus]|uniref:Uncharacterized protein n=1 Tax=Araneus ventricosus TaxID=182803 RepID=A0A4Y2TLB6_ARAVE|nr:hypothetical protein AVEN_224026-1 [Araneus ventricosus]
MRSCAMRYKLNPCFHSQCLVVRSLKNISLPVMGKKRPVPEGSPEGSLDSSGEMLANTQISKASMSTEGGRSTARAPVRTIVEYPSWEQCD